MVFELITGDLLFDPREGDGYDRDEGTNIHSSSCAIVCVSFVLLFLRSTWRSGFNSGADIESVPSLQIILPNFRSFLERFRNLLL
jgi:hypothetical protein